MTTLTMPARGTAPVTDDRAVIATDAAGVIRHVTPAAEELLGHGSHDLIGRSLRSLHVADELQARAGEGRVARLDDLEAVFGGARGVQVPFERQRWTYVRQDSARIRVDTTVTAVYGGSDDVIAFIILLEGAQAVTGPPMPVESPAPSVRFGDDHASNVSHELRTPMAVILGYTEILQSLDAGPLNEQQRAMLDKVERGAHQVLEMMDIARPRPVGTGVSTVAGPVDLVEVVERSVDKISGRLRDKQLRLAVDLGPSPVVVTGRAHQLGVMVDNLLCNAVTFTPDGGTLSVTLTTDHHENVLVVADSGCGIALEERSQVFTRFFQSPSQPACTGQGLGLSTAQAIASMHGGRIGLESCVGAGTDFVVRLPTADPPAPSAPGGW